MRISSNQPQLYFSRSEPVVVKPDRNIRGERIGDGCEYRQGGDYMIISGLQEALFLARMGYDVRLQG